jgi:hypothetical protein
MHLINLNEENVHCSVKPRASRLHVTAIFLIEYKGYIEGIINGKKLKSDKKRKREYPRCCLVKCRQIDRMAETYKEARQMP